MENEKTLSLNDFVYLLLATLAKKSQIIDLNDKSKKILSLPVQYKQIIESILCAENGWKDEFSVLINVEEYFEDHFAWERKLASVIKQTLIDLNKTYEYDFENDRLLIIFPEKEIDVIMSKFPDEELKNIMDHFVYLLLDYIYTRYYQESFNDYYAEAVEKMRDINASKINDNNFIYSQRT